mmetsp:Transcript_26040/g.30242  ORF Transcript_26040/g.30242 Transcript_26040/m.30242 type:complete len:98 (+) Transcript_26040:1932-2225(+)
METIIVSSFKSCTRQSVLTAYMYNNGTIYIYLHNQSTTNHQSSTLCEYGYTFDEDKRNNMYRHLCVAKVNDIIVKAKSLKIKRKTPLMLVPEPPSVS